jgi:hypothetical protein
MKNINILSLVQAHEILDPIEFESFINHYSIEIKPQETEDLKSIITEIGKVSSSVGIFNGFYFGYKIQNISKEFDLLRFGDNYIINVELKNSSTEGKIKRQLTQNNYYLSHTNKTIHNFCYVSETNLLYKLNNSGDLEVVKIKQLTKLLSNQSLIKPDNPDVLFDPSEYLVSPFNSTDKFIKGNYFLTGQQEQFKKEVISKINSDPILFIAITGGPGTGKTLLTYDIVKSVNKLNRTLIVHCGQLNKGHAQLNNHDWKIIPIKNLIQQDLKDFDLVVVDETQRIHSVQLKKLIKHAKRNKTKCIFSYDKQQTLSDTEKQMDIESEIKKTGGAFTFTLSDKIRTNKEIADFIKALFNKKRNNISLPNCRNIDFDYFSDLEDAKKHIEEISNDGWEVLRMTPSQYKKEYHQSYSQISSKTSHAVIGQEFDNVAVIIDRHFSYNKDGSLIYNVKTYYDSVRMLFQNITRTRKKLKLVIIKNKQILNRCLSVLR